MRITPSFPSLFGLGLLLTSGLVACDDTSDGTGGAGTTSSSTGSKMTTSSTTTSSTTTSGTTTTSTTGSTSASTGTGMGMPCKLTEDVCGAGNYCNAPNCMDGTCEPLGKVDEPAEKPVCGCDGNTYWNAELAAKKGASVASMGECAQPDSCGGFGGQQCDAGATCNYEVQNAVECGIADLGGVCWVIPDTCPMVAGFGPNTRACNSLSCTDKCNLIKLQTAWYVDNTCPQ